jgi:homopolymeric O-antigen transport system ATP-binding protein
MRPIIRVESLCKQFRIGARQAQYKTLRESIVKAAQSPFKWFERNGKSKDHTIWALKDVSFEVMPGEVVGIIGRNGAGKSTLLKILSRITEPTTGQVDLYGRVGSLLEIGTGFHAELTGRENIYLNGAILGMKFSEIGDKFDEIVAFAEVEKFIDTPVKHYSSGMYLRLAFAVAAHLEPEILIVDEVLAVGDSSFTKKCLGKMDAVAKQGRTVLFVSHSMSAIQNLCGSTIVLTQGQVKFYGETEQAIKQYLADGESLGVGVCDLSAVQNRNGSGRMRLTKFWVEDAAARQVTTITSGEGCSLVVEYNSVEECLRRDVFMSIWINTLTGAPVSVINTTLLGQNFETAPPKGEIRFEIPKLPLTAGRYVVDLHLATHSGYEMMDYVKGAVSFDVSDGDFYGSGYSGSHQAPTMIEGRWLLSEANYAS